LAKEFGFLAGRRVAEEDVIIDIPEALTFEVDIPVAGTSAGSTAEETTVWRGRDAGFFGRTLRNVSLLVRRDDDLVRAAARYCRGSDPFQP
jgi:hypothetical protein